MKIIIKKVEDPSCFWGVHYHKCDIDSEFLDLKSEIDTFFNDDQLFKSTLVNPEIGMRCVVNCKDKSWQRAHISSVMVGCSGLYISCFLVDNVSTVNVPIIRVYATPAWVWRIEAQGLKFGLDSICPLSLVVDYCTDKVFERPSTSSWTVSAKNYFKQLLDTCNMEADIGNPKKDANNKHWVEMIVKIQGKHFNINELLVAKKFAAVKIHNDTHASTMIHVETHRGFCSNNDGDDINDRSEFLANFSSQTEKEIADCLNVLSEDEYISSTNGKKELDTVIEMESPRIRDMPELISVRNRELPSPNITELPLPKNRELSDIILPRNRELPSKNAELSELISSSSRKLSGLPLSRKRELPLPRKGDLPELISPPRSPATSCNEKDIKTPPRLSRDANGGSHSSHHTLPEKKNTMETTKQLVEILGLHSDSDGFSENERVILALENILQKCKEEKIGHALSSTINSDFELDTSFKFQASVDDRIVENGSSNIANGEIVEKWSKKQKPKNENKPSSEPSFFYETGIGSKFSTRDKSSGLFVKGVEPPKPISLFCVSPFRASIVDCLQDVLKFRGPTVIQAHVWPAVLEGRDVMALTPSRGGKTLSYVVPLVSVVDGAPRLSEHVIKGLNCLQMSFALERNPKVIILCSTWKKVQAVCDYFELFFNALRRNSNHEQHKVLGIFGGPAAEKARSGDLISGCSVLVCSPHSLSRICKANYVSLARLSHLVLDDIHILVEEFTTQIQDIMNLWTATLNDPDRPRVCFVKPQVLGFGLQWTDGVKSFMQRYMGSRPLLYISHPLEAAVYGQVQNKVLLQNRASSFEAVRSIIDYHHADRKGGIAVFVRSYKAMKFVAESLKVNSIACMQVHPNVCDYEINQLQEMLDTEPSSCPVLVILDAVTANLHIDSIQVCIHYEFPENRLSFGHRLSTMQHFYNLDGSADENKLFSYLILTEEEKGESVGLVKFLKRFRQPIPRSLTYLVERYKESYEILKMKKPLCENLQAFGFCQDMTACQQRHFVSSHLDSPNSDSKYVQVPTCGHVKILVKSVTDATHFCGLITKQRDVETNKAIPFDYLAQYENICREMNEYFGCQENCVNFAKNPKPNVVLATKVKNQFFRVKFMFSGAIGNEKPILWITPAGVPKVKVQGVDSGAFHTINYEKLYLLPQHLSQLQYQAIEFRIAGVKPIDGDSHWLQNASELVHDLIFEKEIEGNIMMAVGHTLWLHPVVIRKKLPKSNIHYVDCNVINELLASGLAERNDDHVKKLKMMMGKGNEYKDESKHDNRDSAKHHSITSLPDKDEKTILPLQVKKLPSMKPSKQPDMGVLMNHSEFPLAVKNISPIPVKKLPSMKPSKQPDMGVLMNHSESPLPEKTISSIPAIKLPSKQPDMDVLFNNSESPLTEKNISPIRVKNQQSMKPSKQSVPTMKTPVNASYQPATNQQNIKLSNPSNTNHHSNGKRDLNQSDHSESRSGLLHGYCMQYLQSTNDCAKTRICHHIYIACSESWYYVTERDLQCLYNVWTATSNNSEKRTLVGAFLHLANSGVPLCASLPMEKLVSQCILSEKSLSDLALMLSIVLAKHFSVPALEYLVSVFAKLLAEMLNKENDCAADLRLYSKILIIIDSFLTRDVCLVKTLEDLGIHVALKKLEHFDEIGDQILSIYDKFADYCEVKVGELENTPTRQIEVIPEIKKKQTRKYDILDYDRFNNIDTESCSSFRRPYSPCYAGLDTEADLSDGSNDTEYLHGI